MEQTDGWTTQNVMQRRSCINERKLITNNFQQYISLCFINLTQHLSSQNNRLRRASDATAGARSSGCTFIKYDVFMWSYVSLWAQLFLLRTHHTITGAHC